jgi:hypothetical protein
MASPGMYFRVVCLFLGALFAFGALVQWNDPDPLVWMVAYGFAAGLAAAGARGVFWPRTTAAFALLMACGLCLLAPSLLTAPPEAFASFQMEAPSHEEPREAVGLALISIWNGYLARRGWRLARRGG